MLSGIFADIVVFAHFLWIMFLIAGAYWAENTGRSCWCTGQGLLSQ